MPNRLLLIALLFLSSGALGSGILLLPKTALAPHELGLIVNDSDPLSREVAAYYQRRRAIPERNVIHVRFVPRQASMDPNTFKGLYRMVQAKIPAHVQAFALAWARPYKVGCMSITSAFATGYDTRYCDPATDVRCGQGGRASTTENQFQSVCPGPAAVGAAV